MFRLKTYFRTIHKYKTEAHIKINIYKGPNYKYRKTHKLLRISPKKFNIINPFMKYKNKEFHEIGPKELKLLTLNNKDLVLFYLLKILTNEL